MNSPVEPSRQPSDAASGTEKEPDLFDEKAWDDCDDVDPFDLSRARPEDDEDLLRTELSDELAASLTLEELVTEQKSDQICQNVLQ